MLDSSCIQDNEIERSCIYFPEKGKANTRRTLEIAARHAREMAIAKIVVASTSGRTGLLALDYFSADRMVVVSHSTGFTKPDVQQMSPEIRDKLVNSGAQVLTCQHALGGVNRAVRKKLETYQLDEIIAYTLRLFGQGTKVAVEIVLMAADAGLVSTAVPCIAIGGTSSGADTALVLKPAHAQDFFDLRVLQILAKPF